MQLQGLKVVVIGLGRSGRAAAALLLERGAKVRILERDAGAAVSDEAQALERAGARLDFGPHASGQLGDAALVVLSPGVPQTIPPVLDARAAGIPVLGELELGARLAEGRLLGITGSNGKSTATVLATAMLAASGKDARAGGNLGRPLCDILLEEDGADTLHCLEISSFQCETLEETRLAVVAILNISPDHLDRYADLEAYAEAKLSLLERQDAEGAAVLAAGDPRVAAAADRARGRVAWFGSGELPGPGVGVSGGRLVSTLPGSEGTLADTEALWSPAPHDALNAAAASALALLAGGTVEGVSEALASFRGLPHRCRLVDTEGSVRFIDDSKATNVAAAAAAIRGSARGTVAILGGRHKGGDLQPLLEALVAIEGRALLIGEASEQLAGLFADRVVHEQAASLEGAVARAGELAGSGGTVLLAPACASFDMFSSFEERGEAFAAAARTWAVEGAG